MSTKAKSNGRKSAATAQPVAEPAVEPVNRIEPGGPAVEPAKPVRKSRVTRGKGADVPAILPDIAAALGLNDRKFTQADIPRMLNIAHINFEWAVVTLRGLAPLMCNKAREESLNKIEGSQSGKGQQKNPPRIPDQEFIESCHICEGKYDPAYVKENLYGFPVVGIKKAMANAGYRFGQSKSKVEQMGGFFLHGEYDGLTPILSPTAPAAMTCTLRDGSEPDGDDIVSAVPSMRRDFVIIPATKKGNIAYRPQFWPWEMSFVVRYIPNFYSLDKVINSLILAGRCIGIGSWRIETGGEKGEFTVRDIKLLPNDYQPEVKAKVVDIGRQEGQ